MSDVMLIGVLRMPYEMAMGSTLSQMQYHSRGQEAAERILSDEARIEALEHDKAVLQAKYDQAKTDRDTAWVKHIQEYADLERQLAEEKALGDRLYGDLIKLEVIYDALRDQGHISIDAEDMAIVMRIGHTKARYRKARGM